MKVGIIRLCVLLAVITSGLFSQSTMYNYQFAKSFPDESFKAPLGAHGIAVDPTGRVWIQQWNPPDSIMNAQGNYVQLRDVFCFNADGSKAPFSPIRTVTVGGRTDTLLGTSRGMKADIQGNIIVASNDTYYRLNYKTGVGMHRVTPQAGTVVTAPGIDTFNEMFTANVVPEVGPIRIYDANFASLGNVVDMSEGFSRTIDVSGDGNDVFFASFTNYAVFKYHSPNGSLGPYSHADTVMKGLVVECIARHPKTGYWWVGAGDPTSGSNLPPYQDFTFYAFAPPNYSTPVESFTWHGVNPADEPRPRGIAFSPTGDTVYVCAFNVSNSPCVQMFVKGTGTPSISVSPTLFNVSLQSGDSTNRTLTIGNTGLGTLSFSLSNSGSSHQALASSPFVLSTKNSRELVQSTESNFGTASEEKDITQLLLRNSQAVQPSYSGAAAKNIPVVAASSSRKMTFDEMVRLRGRFQTQTHIIKAVVLDSYGTDYYTSAWDTLNTNWANFGQSPVAVDYVTLNKENITYADLVSSGADVIVLSDAWGSFQGWEFTNAEWAAIKKYVDEGHGLVATCGSLDSFDAPNNPPHLAPMLGLDSTIAYEWSVTGHDLYFVQNLHPLLARMSQPYQPGILATATPEVSHNWGKALRGAQLIAASTDSSSSVVAFRNRVYISHIPENYSVHADYQLLYNAIVWGSMGGSWLSENPTSGSVAPGTSLDVTVRANAKGLTAGNYVDTIRITSNDVANNPQNVPFNLTVTGGSSPTITVSPGSFNVSLQQGDSTTRTMTIGNVGTADLSWNVQSLSSSEYVLVDHAASPFRASSNTSENRSSSIPAKFQDRAFPNNVSAKPVQYNTRASGAIGSGVLIIGDGRTEFSIDSILAGQGISSTIVPMDNVYNGNNPSPTGYSAVVLCDGFSGYETDMPTAGQQALVDYVQAGGQLIIMEWVAYEIEYGRYTTLAPLVPVLRSSGMTGIETYTVVARGPITQGIDSVFSVNTGTNVGTARFGTVLVRGSVGGDVVVLNNVGSGQVIQFASAGDYLDRYPFSGPNMRKMLLNSLGSQSGFISVSPTSGIVTPGSAQNVTVKFSAKNLGNGIFNENIALNSNDLANNPKNVPVSLTVTGGSSPTITVSPGSFNVSLQHGDSTTRTLTIGNIGSVNLSWNIPGGAVLSSQEKGTTGEMKEFFLPTPSVAVDGSSDHQRGTLKRIEGSENTAARRELETFAAFLSGLDGKKVMFDLAHASIQDTSSFTVFLNDLRARGATIDINTAPFTASLLSNYKIMYITEGTGTYASTELSALQNWVTGGGGLLLEGDQFSGDLPTHLVTYGIQYTNVNGGAGNTMNIVTHPITTGCDTIYVSAPLNSLNVTTPAQTVVYDVINLPHIAVSQYGAGRVVVVADDDFFGTTILVADNRTLANKAVDWLAGGASFWSVTPASGIVAPSSTQNVTVKLSAKNLGNGIFNDNIPINSNDLANNPKNVPVSLTVTGGAAITSVVPTSATQGQTLPVSITGQNTSFRVLQGSLTYDANHVWFSQGSSTINASSVSVSSATYLTANFTIPVNASTGPWSVNVEQPQGNGIITLNNGFTINPGGSAVMSLSDPEVDFIGVRVGLSSDVIFAIRDSSTSLSNLTGSVSFSGSGFTIISGGGSFNLTPGQAWYVTVRYTASSGGFAGGSLTITNNSANFPPTLIIPVRGYGVQLASKTKRILFDRTHGSSFGSSSDTAGHSSLLTLLRAAGHTVVTNQTTFNLSGFDYLLSVVPLVPYSPTEVSAIQSFVTNGGGLVVLGERQGGSGATIPQNALLGASGWTTGIRIDSNIVRDTSQMLYGTDYWIRLFTFPNPSHSLLVGVDTMAAYASASLTVTPPALTVVTTTSLGSNQSVEAGPERSNSGQDLGVFEAASPAQGLVHTTSGSISYREKGMESPSNVLIGKIPVIAASSVGNGQIIVLGDDNILSNAAILAPSRYAASIRYARNRVFALNMFQGSGSPIPTAKILSVRDVPNDNGKQVFVQWKVDQPAVSSGIARFGVWRKDTVWTFLKDSVLTVNDSLFQFVALTLYDSTKVSGMRYSVFRITAHSVNPQIYTVSQPDSGYSLDNLAPSVPKGVKGTVQVGGGKYIAKLEWNNVPEKDLRYYAIYRSETDGFTIVDSTTFVGAAADTTYRDSTATYGKKYYYRIVAFDWSGNRSDPSSQIALTITSVDRVGSETPKEYTLSQNYPNPFNPATIIRYGIPTDSRVKIEVFNTIGQLVATLVDGEMDPGYYEVEWNAAVASGIYIYRIETFAKDNPGNAFVQVKKMVFVR